MHREPLAEADADAWTVAGVTLSSRFLLGSAGYPSPEVLREAIRASDTQVVTVGLKRSLASGADNGFVSIVRESLAAQQARLLPNTAGCRSALEAIELAMMARELYDTPWLKLEVIGDEYTLQPDALELIEAARVLVREGFVVWPYCTDDLVTCRRLLDVGCPLLMPWAAPIGSGQGLTDPLALRTLRARLPDAILIVDAGLGAPSHAAQAMELGFDAVLVNSAVALSGDPARMARAFRDAVRAGRDGWRAGLIPVQEFAVASTPVSGQPVLLGGEPRGSG
jgi:thiazole synthase